MAILITIMRIFLATWRTMMNVSINGSICNLNGLNFIHTKRNVSFGELAPISPLLFDTFRKSIWTCMLKIDLRILVVLLDYDSMRNHKFEVNFANVCAISLIFIFLYLLLCIVNIRKFTRSTSRLFINMNLEIGIIKIKYL